MSRIRYATSSSYDIASTLAMKATQSPESSPGAATVLYVLALFFGGSQTIPSGSVACFASSNRKFAASLIIADLNVKLTEFVDAFMLAR